MTVGDRLKKARERKNLKQTQVQEKTGINNKTLSGYERGVSEPDLETLKILAKLYDVKLSWLADEYKENDVVNKDKTDLIVKEIIKKHNLDLSDDPVSVQLLDEIIGAVTKNRIHRNK
ncbi:helix-turn-helix domain-containing protein [Paenibacillus chitinolyticus]|uniref:helix-turn-helix domain-containing protein n=1 Tax=Paenibacillus chitinolyticus TaxID=79263 RepID=UPI0035DFAF74